MIGEETAPNSAASHSLRRVWTVRGGRAVPDDWNSVQPAGRVVNVKERWGNCGVRADRVREAACKRKKGVSEWGFQRGGKKQERRIYWDDFAANTVTWD